MNNTTLQELLNEFDDYLIDMDGIGCPNCGDWFGLSSSMEDGKKVIKQLKQFITRVYKAGAQAHAEGII